MTENKENGKAGEGSGEPFPNLEGNAGADISIEEIEKKIRIAQMRERLMQQLQQIEEEEKQLTEKVRNAKNTIFSEMQKKYGLNEEEIRKAFKEREKKKEIIDKIIDAIERKGREACKEKEFKENMDAFRRIRIVERMMDIDVQKIAVYIDEARRFIEEKMTAEGKEEIHHAGRMSEESIKLLRYVKEQGGRITWNEFREYGKETLGLSTDTLNKRRWGLIDKGYIRREGRDIVITKKGLGRLEEEGC